MSWLPSFLSPTTEPAAPASTVVVIPPVAPKQPHRQLLEHLLDPAHRRRVLYVLGGGVAMILVTKVAVSALGSRLGGDGGVNDEDRDDGADIEFGDPTEARFNAFITKLYRTHEAGLLKLVDDLEALGAMRKSCVETGQLPAEIVSASSAAAATAAASLPSDEVAMVPASEADLAALDAKIRQVAIHADEMLTQYVCKLDSAPVKGSAELKQRRRDMIQASHALGERINRFLPSAQPPAQD